MHFLIWQFSRFMWRLGFTNPFYSLALRHWMQTKAGKKFLEDA